MKAVQSAVSNKIGNVHFKDEINSDCSHVTLSLKETTSTVSCCTIDSWVAETHLSRLDFLKVDVEGHDAEVIEGAVSTIDRFCPIIEFEAFDFNAAMKIVHWLDEFTNTKKYHIFRCFSRYPLSLLSKEEKTNNYFAIPEKKLIDVPEFLLREKILSFCELA